MRRRLISSAATLTMAISLAPVAPRATRAAAAEAPPNASPQLARLSLPEFDARALAASAPSTIFGAGSTPLAQQKAPRAALDRLRRVAPDVRVGWSAATGGPKTLASALGGALSASIAGRPTEAAEAFVRANRDLYGLTDADLGDLRLVRAYETRDTGVTHCFFAQVVDGVEVAGADLRVAVDRDNRVRWVGGELAPGARPVASKRDAWVLGAGEAASAAAANVGSPSAARGVFAKSDVDASVDLAPAASGPGFTAPARAERVLFPFAPGIVRPAWRVTLYERGPGNVYLVTVDATKGTVLARHNMTAYATDAPGGAQFRVFTKDSPQPNLPFSNGSVSEVQRELVAVPLNPTGPSPHGWVGDQFLSLGNNVDAHDDHDGNDTGGARATSTASYVFDPALAFPIDRRSGNADAAITNLFYWGNFMHDYLYALGFDEAAGNFQTVNYTGQGAGNDAVQADAQDGSGQNNANFFTPPDGEPGRVQMFYWSEGYDGDFDQTVIIHEFCHGLSNRLVPGLGGYQAGGMGEGWSDFYALSILAGPDADVDAEYRVGAYVFQAVRGGGLRQYAYSTSLSVNPLTYGDIDPETNQHLGSIPDDEHAVGEVWCATLWDLRADLIRRYGFAEGKALAERLVTDGMKFTPGSPSFVDARDGILVADQMRTGGENQALIWATFARRGLGFDASTAAGFSSTVHEAFTLAPWVRPEGAAFLDRAYYDDRSGAIVARVGDGSLVAAGGAQATLTSSSGDSEALALAPSVGIPGSFDRSVPIATGAPAPNDGSLQVAIGDTITLTYADASSSGAQRVATALFVRHEQVFADDLEGALGDWKPGAFKLTTEAAASPSHSWTDTPGRIYASNTRYVLNLKKAFDLTDSTGSSLVFEQQLDTEPGYDLCLVEARAKGVRWTPVAVFSGNQPEFAPAVVDLSGFDGKSKVKVRFTLVTDPLLNYDGWHIDDVRLVAGRVR